MADYTATQAKTATLTASTLDTVTLAARWRRVEVVVHSEAAVFVRVDSDTAPTVDGDNCFVVIGPGFLVLPSPDTKRTKVGLISSATPKYTVAGLP